MDIWIREELLRHCRAIIGCCRDFGAMWREKTPEKATEWEKRTVESMRQHMSEMEDLLKEAESRLDSMTEEDKEEKREAAYRNYRGLANG